MLVAVTALTMNYGTQERIPCCNHDQEVPRLSPGGCATKPVTQKGT